MVKSPVALHSRVKLEGHVMAGTVVSNMVIIEVHVVELPHASVAVKVTVWLPVAPHPLL
jgi:hypothetical protein